MNREYTITPGIVEGRTVVFVDGTMPTADFPAVVKFCELLGCKFIGYHQAHNFTFVGPFDPDDWEQFARQRRQKSIQARDNAWFCSLFTGASAIAIQQRMNPARPTTFKRNHPHDPSDLNRCLLLLDLVPEWRPRLGEMADVSPAWAALVGEWDNLEGMFLDEVGLNFKKGQSAKQTHERMRTLLEAPVSDRE